MVFDIPFLVTQLACAKRCPKNAERDVRVWVCFLVASRLARAPPCSFGRSVLLAPGQMDPLDPILVAEIESEANQVAGRLRAERSCKVGAPGERAIRAVLLICKRPELTQIDAQRHFGTNPNSFSKYRVLLDQLSAAATSTEHGAEHQAKVVHEQLKPLVQLAWLKQNTPTVSALDVDGVQRAADGSYHRVLRASIELQTGTIERSATVPFDAASGAAEAIWKREAAAVNALARDWAELSTVKAETGGSELVG